MDFTFGIITAGNNDNFITEIIKSIENNNIPNYEIIIVGNTKIPLAKNTRIIAFDETIKPAWITRKKNIIAENAKYENICFLHDYIKLDEGWYEGFLRFGDDYDWGVTKIFNKDGSRFRDYTFYPDKYGNINSPGADIHPYFDKNCLLQYDLVNNINLNKYLYISGAYYFMKKKVAMSHKLNESLVHTQGEDVELSKRLHTNNILIKCNKFSSVSFLKQQRSIYWEKEMNDEMTNYLIQWSKM
ncbi:MAG: glycosyltransferase family 2 protein [Crocinitomicaceae bacterium]|nr:glycosyltransferase family 2 protein [Crocinitomicaceae bacterium]